MHQLIARRCKTYVKQDSVLALNGLLIILGQLLSWLLLYFVAYGLWVLPTIYNAFINREADISLLAVSGGQPSWGLELLARLTLNDQLGDIPAHLNAWTKWLGNLHLTHTTYRYSSKFDLLPPNQHWVIASITALDAASLRLSLTKTLPRAECTQVVIHATQTLETLYAALIVHKNPSRSCFLLNDTLAPRFPKPMP